MNRSEIALGFARGASHDLSNLFGVFFGSDGPGRSDGHVPLPSRLASSTSASAVTSLLPAPSVSTDQDDYAPDSTATITASGFDVGSTVTFEVDHVAQNGEGADGVYGTADDEVVELGGDGHDPWTVTDGGAGDLDGVANGTIVTTWHVNADDSLNERFLLTASDGDVTATNTFTDGPVTTDGPVGASDSNMNDADIDLSYFGADPGTGDPIGQYRNLDVDGAGGFDVAVFTNDVFGAGTGVIDPFVRLQSNGVEQGVNTSGPTVYHEKAADFTRNLTLNEVAVFSNADDPNLPVGEQFLQFRLDVNEVNANGDQFISLDEIKIFVSSDPNLTFSNPGGGPAKDVLLDPDEGDFIGMSDGKTAEDAVELVWDLDAGSLATGDANDRWVALNYDLQAGSGVGDIAMYISLDDFQAAIAQVEADTGLDLNFGNTYVYLYSAFGYSAYDDADPTNSAEAGTAFATDTDFIPLNWVDEDNPPDPIVDQPAFWETSDGFEEWSILRGGTPAEIQGFKREDINGDGDDEAGTDPGIAGWQINLYLDDGIAGFDPALDTFVTSVDTADGVTDDLDGDGVIDPVGFYQFSGLLPGSYWIEEETQTGWTNTTPTVLGPIDLIGGDIYGDEGTENTTFLNFELFDISGTKFTDTNGDGDTTGDSGLGGVTIFIDKDASGTLTAGDETTTTAADGTWSFTDLDASYDGLTVYEVLPTGHVQTLGNAGYAIVGTSGNDQTDLDFANFELFDISGTKFTDTNGDGDTTGDSGLGGVTIFIDKDASGTLTAGDETTTTAADGTWSFTDLDASYDGLTVYEVLPTGHVQTLGNAGYAIVGTSGNDQTDLDFANFELFDISGTKFTDTNGDGDTTGDSGLGGVTIFIDKDASGTLTAGDETTTTAADGTWSFTDLDASYDGLTVYEVLPTGHVQTLGNAGYAIVGTSGNDQTDLDFANFELFDISGTKFTDTNGDGDTTGDSGLGGVTIFIDKDASGTLTAGDETTTTAADGTWSFTDLDASYDGLTVYEVLPTGHVQTLGNAGYAIVGTSGNDQTDLDFANFELFDISGTKFTDTNGDGDTTGDSGLGGVTIFIDKDASGTLTAGDETTTTAADGTWSFTDLDASYDGLTVYEVLPTGHVQTLGNAGYAIVGTSGNDQTDLDFANFELFDISGTKFTDTNGDGDTTGDSGLGGVTIFIDKDASGTLTAGDETTTTAADGTWSFTDLDASYDGLTVYEVLPTGHVQTLGNAGYAIVGTSGNDQTDLDFANFELFDISGTKFTDTNGDGDTTGDSGLGGVTIFIDKDASGTLTAGDETTTTAADGTWSFTDLDASYDGLTVYEVLPTGHVQTLGNAGYAIVGTSGNDQTDLDFANFELFDISGTKFTDTNGDGDTTGDSGLGGVTIFIDKDASGTLTAGDETTTTAADGTWSFTDLDASYDGLTVYEVLPTGHVQTLGNAGYAIVGTSGNDQTDLDFANFELFDISGTKFTDTNGDGDTTGDSGLGGVTIFIDKDASGTLTAGDETTTTAADGTWSFTDLDASYDGLTVYEVLPTGHVQTLGNAGYAIVGTSGNDQTDLDFANFELFDISGTKFTDTNGDGDTTGDSGLGGVTIFIDKDASGTLTAGDETTTTAADGTWSFTDLDASYDGLTVYEVLPTGHVQTLGNAGYAIVGTSGNDQTDLDFANFELFDISGTKFTDTNGDGDTTGDSGLGGVTIFIDKDASGTLTAGDETTTTAADGTWSFTDLDASYDGLTVYEVLPTGHVQTLGNAGYAIVGTSGNDQTDLDFANFELFDISGTKFTDTNGDGDTTGDSGLGGVTIFIDKDASGTLTAGDETTTTAADGTWSFTDLDASYDGLTVYEVLPTGHVQTLGNAGYAIVGTSGNDQTDLDFANFELFDISGTKFTDTNGDGDTTGDSGLGGVTIFIDKDASGTLTAGDETTTTAADGTWSFTDLDASYDGLTVYEVLPTGHVQTLGNAGYAIVGTSGNDQTDLDFANFELMDVSGYKWADLNNNMDWDEADAAVLQGWTIYLDNDDNLANGVIASTTTNADGYYEFTGIGPDDFGTDADGILHVYEAIEPGFTQTFGNFSFNILSGEVIAGSIGVAEDGNFGNHMMEGANRTPGFWQSDLGRTWYDGIEGNEGDVGGSDGDGKDFDEEGWSAFDLLNAYGVDRIGEPDGYEGSNDSFLIWDDAWSTAGGKTVSEDVYITAAELYRWVNGDDGSSKKGRGRDGFDETLERDIAAAFLNTLNNFGLGDDGTGMPPPPDSDIIDSYEDAIFFHLDETGNKKSQKAAWSDYGSDAHTELAAYNENGEAMMASALTQIAMDGDDYSGDLVQNYLAVEDGFDFI